MKNSERELDQQLVRLLINYDPDSGDIFWKHRTPDIHYPRTVNYWNSLYAGKLAGTVNHRKDNDLKYLALNIYNNRYQAHRVIYLYMTGSWPEIIDHIDGNGLNNSWNNLRNVTTGQNVRNMKKSSRNRSGSVGIRYENERNKWHACFMVDGKYIYVGRFDRKSDAEHALNKKRKEYDFTDRHGS